MCVFLCIFVVKSRQATLSSYFNETKTVLILDYFIRRGLGDPSIVRDTPQCFDSPDMKEIPYIIKHHFIFKKHKQNPYILLMKSD